MEYICKLLATGRVSRVQTPDSTTSPTLHHFSRISYKIAMGKPSDRDAQLPAGSSSSAHSLHSLDDNDDLPPPYTDAITDQQQQQQQFPRGIPDQPLLTEDDYTIPGSKRSIGLTVKSRESKTITQAPHLSTNKHDLCNTIQRLAKLPPRPYLEIQGSHTETRGSDSSSSNNGKERRETVIDFEFRVDLTESLLKGWHLNRGGDDNGVNPCWHYVFVVSDGDGQKVFRGGRWRSLEWRERKKKMRSWMGGVSRGHGDGDVERDGYTGEEEEEVLVQPEDEEEQQVSNNDVSRRKLMVWCERFCNDPAPVKS